MINPSIESYNSLFLHRYIFEFFFLEILWETDKQNFIFWNLMCVCKHTLNLNWWNSLCLFPSKFLKQDSKIFLVENCSFQWMCQLYLHLSRTLMWESSKINFQKSFKIVAWAPFWISALYITFTFSISDKVFQKIYWKIFSKRNH